MFLWEGLVWGLRGTRQTGRVGPRAPTSEPGDPPVARHWGSGLNRPVQVGLGWPRDPKPDLKSDPLRGLRGNWKQSIRLTSPICIDLDFIFLCFMARKP